MTCACAIAVRIWEADRRGHPNEQYLRLVLPLVFYQGEHRWSR